MFPACCAGLIRCCVLWLQVIEEEGLQANSAAVGDHLLAGMRALAAKHDIIGDVRGAGLMLGMELVRDRTSKARFLTPIANAGHAASPHHWIIG